MVSVAHNFGRQADRPFCPQGETDFTNFLPHLALLIDIGIAEFNHVGRQVAAGFQGVGEDAGSGDFFHCSRAEGKG